MTKEYIEKEYDQIVKEWKCAASEEERTAGSLFGTEFMNLIHEKYVNMIK